VGPTPEELKTLAAAQHAVPGKRGNFRRMSVLDRIYSRRNSMVLFPVVSKNDKRRLLANMVLFYVTSVLHVVLVLAFMKEEADNAELFTGKAPCAPPPAPPLPLRLNPYALLSTPPPPLDAHLHGAGTKCPPSSATRRVLGPSCWRASFCWRWRAGSRRDPSA
jgi:hypothetical protein